MLCLHDVEMDDACDDAPPRGVLLFVFCFSLCFVNRFFVFESLFSSFSDFLLESLILAQDERWRRA